MKNQIPASERFALTIRTAAQYFGVGEHKLRRIVNENKDANYILWDGTRALIIREAFEKFLSQAGAI